MSSEEAKAHRAIESSSKRNQAGQLVTRAEAGGVSTPGRVLVVDDTEIIRDVYWYVLREAGYDVTLARNGPEALRALRARTPDLILLDIDMPKLSGWETLAIIRSTEEWRDIPVIILSVLVEPSVSERGRYPRYERYVSKKMTGNDLLQLVKQALEHNRPDSPEPIMTQDS